MSKPSLLQIVPQELDIGSEGLAVSGGADILSSDIVEIQPVSTQTSYLASSRDKIEFEIRDASRFLDAQSHYLRFDVLCALTETTDGATARAFASGGAHACFNRIIVSVDGVRIHDSQAYNKRHVVCNMHQSPEYINSTASAWADSVGDRATLAAVGGAAAGIDPARKFVAQQTSAARVCLPLDIPLLKSHMMLPLKYMGPVRIELYLEDPAHVLRYIGSEATPDFTVLPAITISNPRFVARMVRASAEVEQQYAKLYQGGGLYYPMVDYQMSQRQVDQTAVGESMLDLNLSVASIRAAYSVIQSYKEVSATNVVSGGTPLNTTTVAVDSIGSFYKAGVDAYNYAIGSTLIPKQRPVDLSSPIHSEAIAMYLDCKNGSMNKLPLRDLANKWHAIIAAAAYENHLGIVEATKLVLAARFSRHLQSPFAGMSSLQNPLNLTLNWSAAWGFASARNILTWVEFDQMMILDSEQKVSLRK